MGSPFSAEAVAAFAERIVCTPGPATAEEEAEAARLVAADPVTAAFEALGYDLPARAGPRVSLLRACASVVPETEVAAAGHTTAARLSAVELWRFLLPLCQVAIGRAGADGERFLLGIAGPGASGKSVLAAVLLRLIGLCSGGDVNAALCPMDGFHYPNAWLDSHTATGPNGQPVPLRALKGSPGTFDAEAFVACVRAARSADGLSLPRYDRQIHDPVPDGLRIESDDRIVIVEGNYLLLPNPPWDGIAGGLDLALYLDVSRKTVAQAMVARHVRGGRTPEDARAHFERVDRRNYEQCARSAYRADLIARRDAGQAIVSMEPPS
jgi:pantothenate kinase